MRPKDSYFITVIKLLNAKWVLLILSLFTFHAESVLAQTQEYTLGPGDFISIKVYGEPELDTDILLTDSGSTTFPFIGQVQMLGQNIFQIEAYVERELIEREFFISPQVSVTVISYRPFYIDGEVMAPGSYPYEPGLTLRKAVSIAGGFTERASRSKISIENSSSDADEGEGVVGSDNIDLLDTPIEPGTIITVEQRFF